MLSLRVELLKTDSGYPKNAVLTSFFASLEIGSLNILEHLVSTQ